MIHDNLQIHRPLLQLLFQCKYPKEEICAILPTYSYCKQITPQEFEEQKVSTSQAAVAELLENIIKDKNLSVKDKKKKLKQVRNTVDNSSNSDKAFEGRISVPGTDPEQTGDRGMLGFPRRAVRCVWIVCSDWGF